MNALFAKNSADGTPTVKDQELIRKCEKRGIRNSDKRGDANPLNLTLKRPVTDES